MEKSFEKFEQLAAESEKSRSWYASPLEDNCSGLPEEKKKAWAEMLSSVASAEATEEVIMKPLVEHFRNHGELQTYFAAHAQDEFVHAEALKKYVRATFAHEKKKKTLADQVIYGGLFTLFRRFAGTRPLPFIAALFFYESYSERFYDRLQKAAERDGLPVLREMVQRIEKDELRHRAGLKLILKEWSTLKGRADRIDLWLTKTLISVVKADVDTSAFYNERVRRNMDTLGLGPSELDGFAGDYAAKSVAEVERLTETATA
jgi:rubrerythrin